MIKEKVMFYTVLLQFLTICCAAFGQGLEPIKCHDTICIINDKSNGCHVTNVTHTINEIPALQIATEICGSEEVITIYLTSGIHLLNSSFSLKEVKSIELYGESSSNRSIILCSNQSTFPFCNVTENVSMTNIIFENCSQERLGYKNITIQVALYFYNISYSLENVTVRNTAGTGLYAQTCFNQMIINSEFTNNSKGHIKIYIDRASINIQETLFYNGTDKKGGGLYISQISQEVGNSLRLMNCNFIKNRANTGSHIMIETNKLEKKINTVLITNCTFMHGIGKNTSGVFFHKQGENITIQYSNFTDNENGALAIINSQTSINILKTVFCNNSQALELTLSEKINISECMFINHTLLPRHNDPQTVTYIKDTTIIRKGFIVIQNSTFNGNQGRDKNCSSLYVSRIMNLTLDDTVFYDNNCTGIILSASYMTIQNHLNMTRNSGLQGGAMQLRHGFIPIILLFNGGQVKIKSSFIMKSQSRLNLIENSATKYGGGIFADQSCEDKHINDCFFQVEQFTSASKLLNFKGNKAGMAGDEIFGGCLPNCYILKNLTINITNSDNILWNITQLENLSKSSFGNFPSQVVFCTNTNDNKISYSNSHQVKAIRNKPFNVSILVVDDFKFSSSGIACAKIENQCIAHFGQENTCKEVGKHCENFSLSVISDSKSVTLKLFVGSGNLTSSLAVNLTSECPPGFKLDTSQRNCDCSDILTLNGIKCTSDNNIFSLNVPSFTWIGYVSGAIAVQRYCRYCKVEGTKTIHDIANDSHKLCSLNRAGILCGACKDGYSLKLGSYECSDCSHQKYRGLLLIVFVFLGIILVLMLLRLNLTISTGLINGLIFYSNIVYSNRGDFLPINRETNSTHLNNAVYFLATFQAWINLDFGIDTCFFDGLDTYTATWLQFTFPIYIWMLILLIVISNRYSVTLSKITGTNTISVLATLLLLSYAKLLITILKVSSYTRMYLLDGSWTYPVWILDANVRYLHRKHIKLFLMSVAMVIVYILPFTLLVAFGPILQAKSHYRFLKWINNIKPFLDAFYGPYTDKYRYWPGILLFIRIILFFTFAFYTLGDSAFELLTISVFISILFVVWMAIGIIHRVSLYRKRSLILLELFFHLNLVIFSIGSLYLKIKQTTDIHKQQVLTMIMVGSVFIVSCGIISYPIIRTLSTWKIIQKTFWFILQKEKYNELFFTSVDKETGEKEQSGTTTQSTVELKEFDNEATFTELREPLLTN